MYLISPTPRRHGSISSASGDPGNVGRADTERVEGNLKLCETIDCDGDVMCCRCSPDGASVAVGLASGLIKIYDTETSQLTHTLYDEPARIALLPVTCLRFLTSYKSEEKRRLLATYAGGQVKLWHVDTETVLHDANEERQTLTCTFNNTGSSYLTAGSNLHINLYDVDSHQVLRSFEPSDSRDVMNGHRSRIFAVLYHPNESNLFISGGWDDTVQFWDDRQKRSLRRIYGPHICGQSLDIDPTYHHVLTGSWRKENTLQIWDFGSGKQIKDIPEDRLNTCMVYCAQWLGQDCFMCGGTSRNLMRIADRATFNTVGLLTGLPQGVYCMDNDRQQSSRSRIFVGSAKKIFSLSVDKKH